jgi:hypothetical protein
MPRHEDPLTLAYWDRHQDGTLILEPHVGTRRFDGLMIVGGEPRVARWGDRGADWLAEARGRKLRVIQTKAGPLELPVMGQALFSGRLTQRLLTPVTLLSVIVCLNDESEARWLLDDSRMKGEVIVEVVDGIGGGYSRPGRNRELIRRFHRQVLGRGELLENYRIGPHVADAVVVMEGQVDAPMLDGCEIVILHATKFAKRGRPEPLGMSGMGMAVFSEILARRMLKCAAVKSYVLCERKDGDLDAVLEPFRPAVDAIIV